MMLLAGAYEGDLRSGKGSTVPISRIVSHRNPYSQHSGTIIHMPVWSKYPCGALIEVEESAEALVTLGATSTS
jgi:hypothetical protein